MATEKNYRYSHPEMLSAAYTISGNLGDHVNELSLLNTKYTSEYSLDLGFRIKDTMRHYLGESFEQMLIDASNKVNAIQADALKYLKWVKVHVEEYCDGKEKILNELGYNKLWFDALKLKDQEKLEALLSSFTRNIDQHKNELVSTGLNPALLDKIEPLADQLIEANNDQERTKGKRLEVSSKAQEKFNAIYSEVISICKVAQRFYDDQPDIKDKFSFQSVIDRANHYTSNQSEVDSESENTSDENTDITVEE